MHQHIYYVLTDKHGHVFSGLQHTWTCDLPSSLEAQHVRETHMSTQSFFNTIRSHYPRDVNSEILEQGFHILAPKFTPKIVGIPLHFQFSGYQFLEEFEPKRGRPPPKGALHASAASAATAGPFPEDFAPLFHTGGPPSQGGHPRQCRPSALHARFRRFCPHPFIQERYTRVYSKPDPDSGPFWGVFKGPSTPVPPPPARFRRILLPRRFLRPFHQRAENGTLDPSSLDLRFRAQIRVIWANTWGAPNADPTTTDPTPHSRPSDFMGVHARQRKKHTHTHTHKHKHKHKHTHTQTCVVHLGMWTSGAGSLGIELVWQMLSDSFCPWAIAQRHTQCHRSYSFKSWSSLDKKHTHTGGEGKTKSRGQRFCGHLGFSERRRSFLGASEMTAKFLTISYANFPNLIVMGFPRKNSVFGQFSLIVPLPDPLQSATFINIVASVFLICFWFQWYTNYVSAPEMKAPNSVPIMMKEWRRLKTIQDYFFDVAFTFVEAQQRYCSYRAVLVAMVWQNSFVLVFFLGGGGASHNYRAIPCKWGIAQLCLCETKYQGGVSHRSGQC